MQSRDRDTASPSRPNVISTTALSLRRDQPFDRCTSPVATWWPGAGFSWSSGTRASGKGRPLRPWTGWRRSRCPWWRLAAAPRPRCCSWCIPLGPTTLSPEITRALKSRGNAVVWGRRTKWTAITLDRVRWEVSVTRSRRHTCTRSTRRGSSPETQTGGTGAAGRVYGKSDGTISEIGPKCKTSG